MVLLPSLYALGLSALIGCFILSSLILEVFTNTGLAYNGYCWQNGGVFTFGAGSHGQLGHNVAQDEVLPKKIQELMGSTVTQISCGRYYFSSCLLSLGTLISSTLIARFYYFKLVSKIFT